MADLTCAARQHGDDQEHCPLGQLCDGSPFVLIASPDGNAELTVQDTVDDASLAAFLRQVADQVERGEHRTGCTDPACTEHDQH